MDRLSAESHADHQRHGPRPELSVAERDESHLSQQVCQTQTDQEREPERRHAEVGDRVGECGWQIARRRQPRQIDREDAGDGSAEARPGGASGREAKGKDSGNWEEEPGRPRTRTATRPQSGKGGEGGAARVI